MVSDTAITGGTIGARERVYGIKIVPSQDGRALVGYSGDAHHGTRLVDSAASVSGPSEAIAILAEGHREYPSVSFAYGYIDEGGPRLVRVSEGQVQELRTFHIGLPEAFEHFQKIRHDAEIDPTPEAVRTFVCGARGHEPVPSELSIAITSMLRLFAEREGHDVGGWPVPYLLTKEGAFFCSYAFAVSDPILTKIGPGSVLPHGTAEAGGFGLSVTELGDRKGMVVYWLQRPGGTVFLKRAKGYEAVDFDGSPSQFKERALATIGQPVDIFFSQKPHGMPESITVMRDEAGVPSIAIAKHGDSFSFSVLNVGTPFRSRAQVSLKPDSAADKPGGQLSTDQVSIELADDKKNATLKLVQGGQPANQINLLPTELEAIITTLGEARAVMPIGVPAEPRQDAGTREIMVIDPAWRTAPTIHSALNGIILRLRHPGFGWLTFLLPHHEALSLGKWLTEHGEKPTGLTAEPSTEAPKD